MHADLIAAKEGLLILDDIRRHSKRNSRDILRAFGKICHRNIAYERGLFPGNYEILKP